MKNADRDTVSGGISISGGEALNPSDLITPTESGISSRILMKSDHGNVTLFAFDVDQELSEHASPFEALLLGVEGEIAVIVDGKRTILRAETIVRIPANATHSLVAIDRSKMLLIMLRD